MCALYSHGLIREELGSDSIRELLTADSPFLKASIMRAVLWLLMFCCVLCTFQVTSLDFAIEADGNGYQYFKRGVPVGVTFTISGDDIPTSPTKLFQVSFRIGEAGVAQYASQVSGSDPCTFFAHVCLHSQEAKIIVDVAAHPRARRLACCSALQPFQVTFNVLAALPFTEPSVGATRSGSLVGFVLAGDWLVLHTNEAPEALVLYPTRDLAAPVAVPLSDVSGIGVRGNEILVSIAGTRKTILALEYDPVAGALAAGTDVNIPFEPGCEAELDGITVAGDTMLAPVHTYTRNGLADAGAAFVFIHQNGAWHATQTLAAPAPTANEKFAYKQSMAGDIIVIGGIIGRAYIFERSAPGIPYVLVKTASSFGDTVPATQVTFVATDGVYIAVLYKSNVIPNKINIYERGVNGGWVSSTLLFPDKPRALDMSHGLLLVPSYSKSVGTFLSRDSADGKWKEVLTLTTSTLRSFAMDETRICISSNTYEPVCFDSRDDAPAFPSVHFLGYTSAAQDVQVEWRDVAGQATASFPFKLFGAAPTSLGDTYYYSFTDLADYACDMRADPFEFSWSPTASDFTLSLPPLLAYNHTIEAPIGSAFTLEGLARTDAAAASSLVGTGDFVLGESVTATISCSLSPPVARCFHTPGSSRVVPGLAAFRFTIDLGPLPRLSTGNTPIQVCVANWVLGGGPYCLSSSSYALLGAVYPFVFPQASVSAAGLTTLRLGFVNELYVPIPHNPTSLAIDGAPVAVSLCSDGVCPVTLSGAAGIASARLLVEATLSVPGTPGSDVSVTHTVSVALGDRRPPQRTAVARETTARFSLFDAAGNPLKDFLPVDVFHNGALV
eukprot:gnl/Chilomastix_cuspidata/2747.p1 GENE.gnl/Chilomastix_cuspidata/2747~~gnl/Chilomastix_cuspidata/2747.p1  ORF type:complete len:839 (+),score=294.72 gnl/Chilomastix_cuspidata/2747:702-3218(+)